MRRLSPTQVIALGFLVTIFTGGMILSLPISGKDGSVGLLNALFTSTSAVCVTGLVVVDTATSYSRFGQIIILLLLQIGGLGYMTCSAVVSLIFGRQLSIRDRLTLQEAHGQFSLHGLIELTKRIVIVTLSIEAFGAALLSYKFALNTDLSARESIYYGIFHAVSAFCNAGFDLFGSIYGPYSSFIGYVGDVVVNLVIASLIIIGGIGFSVLVEVPYIKRFHDFSLHAKVALSATLCLILMGTFGVMVMEWSNPKTLAPLPFSAKLLGSYFQAVTPRTAGFNTLSIGDMHSATLFFICLLMFTGASPGGTGGGVKTTTFALILSTAWASIRGKVDPEMFGRRIRSELVYKALAVAGLSINIVVIPALVLSITELGNLEKFGIVGNNFLRILFETVSAFGTVGLSTGITPYLSAFGKLVIIFVMFSGRVGPLTIGSALVHSQSPVRRTLPDEKIMIG